MVNGISNNWQNVQLTPLTLEKAAGSHLNYKGGQNLPAAALFYEQPQKKGSWSGFLFKVAVLAGGLYALARFGGKNMNMEKAGKFKQNIQTWSEKYVKNVDKGCAWLKIKVIELKDKFFKPKTAEESVPN